MYKRFKWRKYFVTVKGGKQRAMDVLGYNKKPRLLMIEKAFRTYSKDMFIVYAKPIPYSGGKTR